MAWPKKIRKYQRGDRIGIYHVVAAIERGDYLYWCSWSLNPCRYQLMHPRVLENWSLATLRSQAKCGRIYAAELTPEWRALHPELVETEEMT